MGTGVPSDSWLDAYEYQGVFGINKLAECSQSPIYRNTVPTPPLLNGLSSVLASCRSKHFCFPVSLLVIKAGKLQALAFMGSPCTD